jgi:uncharacterized protein
MTDAGLPGDGGVAKPKRSPYRFFALVALLAAPFWVAGALLRPPADFPVRLPVSALWFVCPILAAAILVHREQGLRGLGRFLRTALSARGVRWPWFAVVVVLPPAIYAASYGLTVLLGRPVSEPRFPIADVALLSAVFLVAAIAEEAGWTGYAAEPLRERSGALGAAIILGAVTGGLHVIPDLQGNHDADWIIGQRALFGVAFRIMLMWIWANTGSVLAVAAYHAIDNLSWQVYSDGAPYDPFVVGGLLAGTSLVVIAAYGTRTLTGRAAP